MLEWIVGLVAVGIALLVLGPRLLKAVITRQIERSAKEADVQTDDPVLSDLAPGKPAIIYFTAEWCTPCKMMQTPALERLQAKTGDRVQIVTIDVDEKPEIAKRWNVMSEPRTFIVNSHGQMYGVNLDAVNEHLLLRQLDDAEDIAPDAEMLILSK